MKNKAKIINTDERTFLVSFMWKITSNKFIVNKQGLIDVLKTQDTNGIESIKEFSYANNKFMRVSKKDILQLFSWDTENILYLEKHYYFTK